ncbi:GntR family transcriptional regulator [Amycolatopsis rhabdoformis]|uniref:GntR family transcriptional regulator n=1 Tax=Amycolatopsis rhabdoformis TaxID=1448059 RepID=A0ABZ1IHE3_9PSEU|nr:GntR family transcriptional regulator [Amycolatopsis rhabdoformis]WSE33549.1 GntR family transcriptional regulator [Amycolatopsis rhabdoformis]
MTAELDLSELDVAAAQLGRRITADYIADALRNAINAGRIPDGAELNQVELAARFGVSRVPVREALRQLKAEGLVESEAHRLSQVRGIGPDRLVEVFTLRALLEGWLVERAVPRIGQATLAAAREINERLRGEADHPAWLELNTEFHRLLFQPSDAVTGFELLEPLRQRSERYTRLWSQGNGMHRPEETCAEHDDILRLVEAGDAAGAKTASEAHVMHTCEAVIAAGKLLGKGNT